MTNTRFDLEQQIMNCWSVVEDIKTIAEAFTETRAQNVEIALAGMAELYNIKFEKLFNTFEKMLAEEREGKKQPKPKTEKLIL